METYQSRSKLATAAYMHSTSPPLNCSLPDLGPAANMFPPQHHLFHPFHNSHRWYLVSSFPTNLTFANLPDRDNHICRHQVVRPTECIHEMAQGNLSVTVGTSLVRSEKRLGIAQRLSVLKKIVSVSSMNR